MIFSTITQNNLNLTADTTEIPAQYSNNIQFKFIQDSERFSGYIPTIYIGVYDSAMIECSDVISAGGAVVVDGDGVFAISNEIMYRNGFLAVGVTLTNNDENVSLKPVIYRIQASVGGLSPLPPDVGEWQQVVKAFVETLFNNWSAENLDPIKAQLEELISTAQTQQEKITSQQTQIDNAIGNMGDYEIVQEDPVQIRFKKGDGTFGETVDLGDGLASKAMVNAGYYTYKGISYGGSASNNGIDVAEIDGAYSQVTTNGFQLFDASKLPTKSQGGATITNNGDGSFTISGSGVASSQISIYYDFTHEETLKLLKVGELILNCGIKTFPYCYIQLRNSNGILFGLSNSSDSITKSSVTNVMLEDSSSFLRIGFINDAIQPTIIGTIKPMLYQDGDGTWEPFTGGVASPNPEYPQEPKFIGDYNEDTQKYDIGFVTSGKNLLNNEANTFSLKGVTFTINKDKSILLSGTATETIYWNDGKLSANLDNDKIYTLSGCPSGGGLSKYYMYLYNESFSLNDTGNGVTNMSKVTKKVVFGIAIFSGVNVDGLVFKPQLEIGTTATDYQPYQGFETTTVELNQPLRELPNGVKDTIENGVVTRRVGVVTFDGSEAWNRNNVNDPNNWLYYHSMSHGKADGLCNSLMHESFNIINKGVDLASVGFNLAHNENNIFVNVGYYMELIGLANTAENLKTWLQSNPITIWYELATPTTEQITLPTLPSWYPYTNAWVGTELQPSFVEWYIKTAGVNQNDLTVIKEDISQLQTETTHLNDDVTKLMGAFTSVTDLTKQLFLLMHRVGDIIFSTSDENPSTIYGGTWVAWGKGQVPVGVDASDSDFNTVEKTGGEKEHTLTVDEMPSHSHIQTWNGNIMVGGGSGGESTNGSYLNEGGNGIYPATLTNNVGNSHSHNNLQPYITCYMWKRTA